MQRLTRRRLMIAGTAALAVTALGPAQAADTIKIGVIMPYSGIFADTASDVDAGIKLYMAQHGDTVAGKKIEIIRKDVGGANPAAAKRLAQELLTRDKVDILAGFVLTPNAMAASDISAEGKLPMVIMNAATSSIVTKSPYSVRVSMTEAQLDTPFGAWAAKEGIQSTYIMVSDYGPGHDAEKFFGAAFKAGGGKVLGSVRMPLGNLDFSAFVQGAKDSGAQSVFVFLPAGPEPAALMKTMLDRGMSPDKVKILGSGNLTDVRVLKRLPAEAAGVLTSFHYDPAHKSDANSAFVKAFRAANKDEIPNLLSVGGYDGMHLIYEALKKTGGKADGDSFIAAAKGMKWESPRGPISIDPETRDIVQNVYVRRLEKAGDRLVNVEIFTAKDVKDPGK